MIHEKLAQPMVMDEAGNHFIEHDWYPKSLPSNITLEEMSYPDTSYSFSTFYSKRKEGFRMGFASGNYGHGIFTTGVNGEINIGKFVVLQCTRIICNLRIDIMDHCMFSWGSTITDSWPTHASLSIAQRQRLLEAVSVDPNRHLEFDTPRPVLINENVWVGFEAVILPGVTIGRGAIIGSKSVISEDVPPYAVVVGNPGRIIKYLSPTDTMQNIRIEEYMNYHTGS